MAMAHFDPMEWAFEVVYAMGLPLALLAWGVVVGAVIGMGFVLRRRSMRGRWLPSLAIGMLGVLGHGADILVTVKVSPDLSLEANPMWRAVVDRLGLPFAMFYGFSGQVFVCILSVQLFAFYLIERESLFPAEANGPLEFIRGFGANLPRRFGVSGQTTVSFFAFLFPMLGPYFLYVAFLNSMVRDEERYARWPSVNVAVCVWLAFIGVAWFAENYRAFRASQARRAASAPAAS